MDLGLKNKIAIVTGGARGVGAGICEVLAQEGADLVINDLNITDETHEFADRLTREYGVRTLLVPADVGDEAQIMQIFQKTYETFGTVDIVVNNAFFLNNSTGPIETFDPVKFQVAERVIVEAALITSRELIKHCKEHDKPGHIVNMLSKSAFLTSSPHHVTYIAAKGACAALTRGLAFEAAPYKIFVNGVIPGYVFNSRTDVNSERYKRTIQYIPLKRYGMPMEIGNVVAFLCSEKACQMNGALVDCTGGTMNGQM
ncbi:SDR family NAD(P)-dependent oxidoreductase [Intestinimonas massiliensis (ex Afouda et al. 2020)]|uniref:SDR family NAD(P)-dependent oxidoreductase n=1 Tax=Intestinimonas massiliensis (ex Afouda et al. 2020) TaxID=1673721 RepID=UPI001031E245|nr:SDR family oxidoreductase [Intestinimonas massiliensis (ex Afouda et al. 2020)]